MRPTPDVAPSSRALLTADHGRLEHLARELLVKARAGDAPDLCPTWNQFETGLRAHFDAEEKEIFPLFEVSHRKETADLYAEHARIRLKLDELGFGVELHEVRASTIEQLVILLREHAAREENLLYRWTEQHLPSKGRERLVAGLQRGVQRLASGGRGRRANAGSP